MEAILKTVSKPNMSTLMILKLFYKYIVDININL